MVVLVDQVQLKFLGFVFLVNFWVISLSIEQYLLCFGLVFSTSASFFSSYPIDHACLFFLVSICNYFVVAFTSFCPSPYGENLSVFHSMTARQPFLFPPRSQRKRSFTVVADADQSAIPKQTKPYKSTASMTSHA